MDDRYTALTPPLLVASLRSMPRRFTEALELAAPKTPDAVIEHAAADIGAMVAQLDVLDEAIHTTADHDGDPLPAVVDRAVSDAGVVDGAAGDNRMETEVPSAEEALASIEATTGRIADRLDRLSADHWNRTARSPRALYTVTELAQGAVRVAAERLRATERAIAAVRAD